MPRLLDRVISSAPTYRESAALAAGIAIAPQYIRAGVAESLAITRG